MDSKLTNSVKKTIKGNLLSSVDTTDPSKVIVEDTDVGRITEGDVRNTMHDVDKYIPEW